MSGASEKRLPLEMWCQQTKTHVKLLPSGDAIEALKADLRLRKKAVLAEMESTQQLEPVTDTDAETRAEQLLTMENMLLLLDLTLEEKALQAELEVTFEAKKALQDRQDIKLVGSLMALMPLINSLKAELTSKNKMLVTETEQQSTLKEKTLLTEPERELKALLAELEPTLENVMNLEAVTDTDTDTYTDADTGSELSLEKNALQLKLVTDTDTGTDPELPVEDIMLMMIEGDPELTEEQKVLQGLHIVCCKEFTEYDPRKNVFVCTRFCSFNIAFFDLDEESEAIVGPPLKELTCSQWELMEESSVNVISLKVTESDEPYPIHVFGTVLARDEADYKCIYLFRRERDDSQCINSEEDMLTLTGPCRGLAVSDTMFFEINLKIKGDEITDDRIFSKGVIECYLVPFDKRPVAVRLSSWLSTLELVCVPVAYPVAVTLEVNILNGPLDLPFNGKITAWTTGNADNHIILYEYDDSKVTGAPALTEDGCSVVLARNLVAVPNPLFDEDTDSVLKVCFVGKDEQTLVIFQYPNEESFCSHGSYELHVKVAWTAMLTSPMREDIQKRWLALPRRSFGVP